MPVVPLESTLGRDDPEGKPNSEAATLQHANASLCQRIGSLEKKLICLEKESEKVVSELRNIIERKNERISQLELQLAGIQFMDEK